ncbi:MAG: ABC transporter six-transmembrane domain-containing protein [Calditrichia bacterium]
MKQLHTKPISLSNLLYRFRAKILYTWTLVVAEAVLLLLFPLFMGIAIDDFVKGSYRGLYALTGIAFVSLIAGAGRRFYDTRTYAQIYTTISPEMVEKEQRRNSTTSVISARVNLATEFVEFLENHFPAMFASIIALSGTIIIIYFMNINVFFACVISTILIGILYALTSRKTYSLNGDFNSELENQVSVLSGNEPHIIATHFKNVMRWNIRLSDLETVNFSLSWIVLMALLVYAIIAVIESGISAHGQVLAILMYVFNYIESVITIPLFYQQFVRLKEIAHRLEYGEQKIN